MAQTTAEEEISKGNIRDLAGELGATGDVGVGIAAQDLKTAEFKVAQATIVVQKAQQETQEKSKAAADIRATAEVRTNEILKRSEEQLEQIQDDNARTAAATEKAAEILKENNGGHSLDTSDERVYKTQSQILKEAEQSSKVDQRVAVMNSSGKFTGSKRKTVLGAANLASISQSIVRANAQQAGKFGGKLGALGTGGAKLGEALQRGGTGFTKTLQAGGGFKDALKAGFKGLNRGLGVQSGAGIGKTLIKLTQGFKDFAAPFKEGAALGRGARAGKFTSGFLGAQAGQVLPKGLRQQLGNFGGIIKDIAIKSKDLTKSFGRGSLTVAKFVSQKSGLDFMARNTRVVGRIAGRGAAGLAEAASTAIAGSNVGKAFQLGKTGTKLGEKVAATGTRIGFSTTAAAAKVIESTGRGAATANLLGRTSNQLGKITAPLKNIASQGGKKLLGKGLEGAGKLGVKAFSKFGSKIPLIGAAISAGFGAYEAKQAGENTGGIAGGALLGLLSGSAYAGDSIFTSGANLLGAGIERGGTVDKGLGVIGAGLHGAFTGAAIGTALGGPVGTVVGAGVGAALGLITEGIKVAYSVNDIKGAQEVEAELASGKDSSGKVITGQTSEILGNSFASDGSVLSSSLESNVSGFGGLAGQRDAILAASTQTASPVMNPGSVQAAGGPAFSGPLPNVAAGVAGGSAAGGIDQAGLMQVMNVFSQNIGNFGVQMQKFNEGLAQNIKELKDLKFKIQLDGPTNVNVNFQNAGFLSQLTEGLKNELLKIVAQEMIPTISHDNVSGNHKYNGSVLG